LVESWSPFAVSVFSAYIGVLIEGRVHGVKRGVLGNIFLGFYWGFIAIILTFFINMMGYDDAYYDNIIVGVIYGYLMADVIEG